MMKKSADISVSSYTTLAILQDMRQKLGLEAMVEYMDKYLDIIGTHNPKIKSAVNQALSLVSVNKMYEDMMHD